MKQRINPGNYEAWLLDRLEGRLSPHEERELHAFLLVHPHLDPGADGLPTVGHAAGALEPSEKQLLKRELPPHGAVTDRNLTDFIIARHEGDLSPEQDEALGVFLRAHPEHARTERLIIAARAPRGPVSFGDRSALHRALPPTGHPSMAHLDDFLVARMEGDLSAEQERALEAIIATDEGARRQWTTMQATRIPADAIAFPHKDAMKRSAKVIPIARGVWVRRMAAAAAVLLLIGIGWWWLRGPSASEERYARQDPAPAPKLEALTDEQPISDKKEPGSGPSNHGARPRPEAPRFPGSKTPISIADSASHVPAPAPIEPVPSPEQLPVAQEQSATADTTRNAAPPPGSRPDVHEPVAVDAAPHHAEQVEARVVPSIRQALTGAVRERVLNRPADHQRALDDRDAEAAADRAVRALAGEHAGFALARDAQGKRRGFKLKLGRHMAVSARR